MKLENPVEASNCTRKFPCRERQVTYTGMHVAQTSLTAISNKVVEVVYVAKLSPQTISPYVTALPASSNYVGCVVPVYQISHFTRRGGSSFLRFTNEDYPLRDASITHDEGHLKYHEFKGSRQICGFRCFVPRRNSFSKQRFTSVPSFPGAAGWYPIHYSVHCFGEQSSSQKTHFPRRIPLYMTRCLA